MQVVDMSAVELFAVVIAANVHCVLAALGLREAVKIMRKGERGEKVVAVAGVVALIGLPMVLAYRAMTA